MLLFICSILESKYSPTLKQKSDTVFVVHILIDNVKEMIMHYVYMDSLCKCNMSYL